MKKRNFWPFLFIAIFSFTFGMIVWTIDSAIETPVHEDEAFFMSYHELKDNYNKVVESNESFNKKYNFELKINDRVFPLIIHDMFLSQRVIEEKSKHKDILKHGKNMFDINITDKTANKEIEDVNISFRISRPTNNNNTMDFENKDFKLENGIHKLLVDLPLKGNWNITATFKIGSDTGYFYLKSNAVAN